MLRPPRLTLFFGSNSREIGMAAWRCIQTLWRAAPSFGAACLSAIVFGAAVSASAQQPQLPQSSPQARIVVTGEGTVSVAPDSALLTSGATTRAKTVRDATSANSKTMAAVTAALLDAGIAEKDIQTSRFSVQPVYASAQPGTEQKLTGFSVSNEVNVTIRQIGKVGDVLDRVIAAGATDVGGVEFLHSDIAKLLDQARSAAVADARRKAELYAQASGVDLGAVVWITEQGAPDVARLRSTIARKPLPISAGEDSLQASVTVGFDIRS
jgi:hypothetical protein